MIPDLLSSLAPNFDLAEIHRLRQLATISVDLNLYQPMADALAELPDDLGEVKFDLTGPAIKIGKSSDLSSEQHLLLEKAIQAMLPWRKGPFELFGHPVDAEWQANLKWDRIAPGLGELHGRKILDLGCDNGYYMFRAAAGRPKAVVGFDPSIQCAMKFELMQRFLQLKNVQFERLGLEHLYVFDRVFDIGICMGVLYHHSDPVGVLRKLRNTIRVGGFAMIECQTIPETGSYALVPNERYAKAKNVYFVPTKDCLINWIRKSGFKNIEVISHIKLTTEEQRSTAMMPKQSLADFLDPIDSGLTLEGYSAPYRTAIRAERQFI